MHDGVGSSVKAAHSKHLQQQWQHSRVYDALPKPLMPHLPTR
jgi:hypothetical protein